MTDELELDHATFAHWRRLAIQKPPAPTALDLAGHIEGRLQEAEAAAIDLALVATPALMALWIDARHPLTPEAPSEAALERAKALVVDRTVSQSGAAIVPFPVRHRSPLASWLTWGAVAASLVIVSAAGFRLGIEADRVISAGVSSDQATGDLFDHLTPGEDVG